MSSGKCLLISSFTPPTVRSLQIVEPYIRSTEVSMKLIGLESLRNARLPMGFTTIKNLLEDVQQPTAVRIVAAKALQLYTTYGQPEVSEAKTFLQNVNFYKSFMYH